MQADVPFILPRPLPSREEGVIPPSRWGRLGGGEKPRRATELRRPAQGAHSLARSNRVSAVMSSRFGLDARRP